MLPQSGNRFFLRNSIHSTLADATPALAGMIRRKMPSNPSATGRDYYQETRIDGMQTETEWDCVYTNPNALLSA